MKYWLMKSEPSVFGIDDLARLGVSCWEGVRNYQARNFMRDEMRVGDRVLMYHSNAVPPGIAGLVVVCREAYPDHFSWDISSPYFDKKSTPEKPIWMMVDVKFERKFSGIVSLEAMRGMPVLSGMRVLQRGCRLSVQPVSKAHFDCILELPQCR